MSGCIAAFSAMAVAGRAVHAVHDTFEIMLWRSAIGFLLVAGTGAALGRLGEIRTERLGAHLGRNLVHYTGQNLWFFALPLIPLAQVFALEFTTPIWVILFAALFLGERLTRRKLLAACLGFAGVLIVAHPEISRPEIGVLAAATSAICFAGTSVITKALTRVEGIISILFWLTLFQTVFSLFAVFHDGTTAWPTAETLPWLALLGLSGVGAHLCVTKALSLAPASVVMPIDFARLPVIAVVGWAVYGEVLEWQVAVGAAVILLAILVILRPARRASGNSDPVKFP